MYMRLTPREKEMADMFEQMSKEEQEIMIELASYGMQEKRDLHYLLLNGRRKEKS